jgi:hypothetical protein
MKRAFIEQLFIEPSLFELNLLEPNLLEPAHFAESEAKRPLLQLFCAIFTRFIAEVTKVTRCCLPDRVDWCNYK